MSARIEGPGEVVAGRYRIVRRLGAGGMGEVFLANQIDLGRLVVLKQVRSGYDGVRELLDEARVAARLGHPNIVGVLDVSRDGEPPFVVMEYLPGVSLREVIERAPGGLPRELALTIALDVLRGLAHAHGVRAGKHHGVVHRDVKPRNIMVTFAGTSKLIDFGISRWLDDGDDGGAHGTRGYMAPEQHEGGRVAAAADQFALAVTLWEMTTGELPALEDDTSVAGRSPSAPRAPLGGELGAIVARATARAPGDRFADCGAMAAAIEALARAEQVVPSASAVARWLAAQFAPELAASEDESSHLDEVAEVRPGAAATNLAAPADSFVGREPELLAVMQHLTRGARRIALLGPPGIGKTRLACEIGWRRRDDLGGGAWFVDLTEARTLDGVIAGIANGLGVAGLDGALDAAIGQLGAAIAHRGHVLLVIDNVEQVVDPAAVAIARLAVHAPDARWLVTSRERLNLAGEIAVELGPLGGGGGEAGLALLVERARAAHPELALAGSDHDDLAAVAARLEGNPLAIELAAGRLRLLSPHQLRERLAAGFDVLSGRRRGVPERQTAFDKAVAWSWQMLEPWEQRALAQAAVFRGGFAIEAAEAVIDLGPGAPAILDVLASLTDKSLLRRVASPELPDLPRFGMFEAIREFALGHLGDDAAAARDRHAAYYLAYAEPWAAADRYPQARERARRLGAEVENIWAVVEPALGAAPRPSIAARALRALATLAPVYEARGMRGLVGRALDALLDGEVAAAAPPAARAIAWYERSRLWPRNQVDAIWSCLDRAMTIAREHGLDDVLAWSMARAVLLASDRHDRAGRDRLLAEAFSRFAGDDLLDWRALASAQVLMYGKVDPIDPALGATIVEQASAAAAASQRPGVLAQLHWALGVHHLLQGELERCQPHLAEVVTLYEETGDAARSLALARGNLAAIHLALDRELDTALGLAERARRSLLEMGLPVSVPFCDFNLALIREGLGDLAGAEAEARRCLERQTAAGAGSNWLLREDAGRVAALAELAIVQALRGRCEAAEISLARARGWAARWAAGTDLSPSVVAAALAIVDCAEAHCALARHGAAGRAAARAALARAHARGDAAWSDEVHVIVRRAERRLAAL